jgi:predicted kinase
MSKAKLIVMSGLPGSGKSTIAEGIAKALNIPVFSVDPIESAILKSGIGKSFETGLAAYLVAKTLASEHLKLGISVIIDAVNAEEEGKDVWRSLAKEHSLELLLIECFVADTTLHKNRIKSRVRNLHGIPEVTWDNVETRRKKYTQWKELVLKLDSSSPANLSVQTAIEYIQSR